MGDWKIIKAEATTDLFKDSGFYDADPDTHWDVSGDGTTPDVTLDTSNAFYGWGSAKFDIDDGTLTKLVQSITTAANAHYLSCKVRRSGGGAVTATQFKFDIEGTPTSPDSFTLIRGDWYLAELSFTPTVGAHNYGLVAYEADLNCDGAQLEEKSYRTTYCDGEQPGCRWVGDRYGSQSKRDEQSRDGGRVYDLSDDYSIEVERHSGLGMPPVTNSRLDYTQIPGSEFRRTKIHDRVIMLDLWVSGTSVSNLHSLRQALIQLIGPEEPEGQQSFILRYQGATAYKQIRCRYEAGLEQGWWPALVERVPLRLWAEDPFWYGYGEQSAALDSNDTIAFKTVYGRVDGAWDDLGPPSASSTVYALAWGPDKCLYIGGAFTNWDGIANADYIVKWDPEAGTYSALGTGMQGGNVHALAFGPDGDLYAGGMFTGAGGVANTDNIARWDGSAWNSLGGGATNNAVDALAFDADGQCWAGGNFTTIGGDSATRVAYWDGTNWNETKASGAGGRVYAIALHPSGDMYAGGDFVTIGNKSCARVARYSDGNWYAMGDGVGDTVKAIAIAADGTVYIGGEFMDQGNRVCSWNGSSYTSMTDYFNDDEVNALLIGPDGVLYAAGTGGGDVTPGAGAGPWWDPNDVPLPVNRAYRFIGADNYETAKMDQTGNGPDLEEYGGALEWSAGNGLEIQAEHGRALLTDFVPDADQEQTFLIQVANITAGTKHVYPIGSMNAARERFGFNHRSSTGSTYHNGDKEYVAHAAKVAGNWGVSKDQGYVDGVADGAAIGGWNQPGPTKAPVVAIGGMMTTRGLVCGEACYIEGAVLCDGELTALQMADVEAEMAAWGAFDSPSSDSVHVVASWDGAAWVPVDSVAPGEPAALAAGEERLAGYDLYVGGASAATEQIAGTTTVNNGGTAQAQPIIYIKRSGGAGAKIVSIVNYTTGEALHFDYQLLDGETVVVDLVKKTITSDFQGNVLSQMLAASAFGAFALMPEDNEIACFIEEDTAPTVTAYMVWQEPYLSVD